MTAFPTADHLISWAGMCPRLDESAGRKRSKRLRKGAPWLKPVLVQAALAAIKVKTSSLRARYFSLKPRLGHKKAIIAVAAAMLRIAYHKRGLETRVEFPDGPLELLNCLQVLADQEPMMIARTSVQSRGEVLARAGKPRMAEFGQPSRIALSRDDRLRDAPAA